MWLAAVANQAMEGCGLDFGAWGTIGGAIMGMDISSTLSSYSLTCYPFLSSDVKNLQKEALSPFMGTFSMSEPWLIEFDLCQISNHLSSKMSHSKPVRVACHLTRGWFFLKFALAKEERTNLLKGDPSIKTSHSRWVRPFSQWVWSPLYSILVNFLANWLYCVK